MELSKFAIEHFNAKRYIWTLVGCLNIRVLVAQKQYKLWTRLNNPGKDSFFQSFSIFSKAKIGLEAWLTIPTGSGPRATQKQFSLIGYDWNIVGMRQSLVRAKNSQNPLCLWETVHVTWSHYRTLIIFLNILIFEYRFKI